MHRFIAQQSGIRAQAAYSTKSKDGRAKIECFVGWKFGFWKMRIEDYLYQKKLHAPLSEITPSVMKAEDWALWIDRLWAKLPLSWLPDTWSGIVTTVRSTSGTNKLTFKDNKDMILGEDIRRRNSGEYPNSFLRSIDASNDAPSCCVEEYYESWVMDSGTSFHATPCIGMMKNFKLLLAKVRLVDIKSWVVEDNGTREDF
ncbi:hypothetical protein Tco_0830369 [Tanacetum coccineum]